MDKETIRTEYLSDMDENNRVVETKIPITLSSEGDEFAIDIDGVEWVRVKNKVHAVVLFEMMKDNITDYMNYVLRNE
jgi:hypothetical protein